MLGKPDLNKREMHDVVMRTEEPDSTRDATKRLVKIRGSTYARAELNHAANNAIHMNAEERTQLLRILEYFKDLFDGTLGDWATQPVDLEPIPGSKLFNSKYYPAPRINKENFFKELKHVVEIGVLTPVQ